MWICETINPYNLGCDRRIKLKITTFGTGRFGSSERRKDQNQSRQKIKTRGSNIKCVCVWQINVRCWWACLHTNHIFNNTITCLYGLPNITVTLVNVELDWTEIKQVELHAGNKVKMMANKMEKSLKAVDINTLLTKYSHIYKVLVRVSLTSSFVILFQRDNKCLAGFYQDKKREKMWKFGSNLLW